MIIAFAVFTKAKLGVIPSAAPTASVLRVNRADGAVMTTPAATAPDVLTHASMPGVYWCVLDANNAPTATHDTVVRFATTDATVDLRQIDYLVNNLSVPGSHVWSVASRSMPAAEREAAAAAVWDKQRSSHTAAGSFGESLQPATGQITSATASTVTLPSPYDTGRAKDREIVIGNQARTLGTHVAGGEYQLNRNWDSTPPDGSDYWLGGVGELGSASAPTASEVAGAVWDRPRNSHTTAGTFGHGVASVQGPVTGSVGSVVGSVGSVTGSVGSVTGSVGSVAGNVGGSVGSVLGAVGSVTAGVKLASDGLDTIVIETGVNARQALSPIFAAAAGVLMGAPLGPIVIKGGNVDTTRISATIDEHGNRTVVVLTLPS